MDHERLRLYDSAAALDRAEEQRPELERPGGEPPDVGPGGPPCRFLWCRIAAGAPADPPDERYYAGEVRPGAAGEDGRIAWEPAPGGLTDLVVHNVAEAAAGTHALPQDTVVRVEARLDRSDPPEMVYLTSAAAPDRRLGQVVSYDDGSYTVQPVRWQSGSLVDDGPTISGVENLGELWDDEAGYLTGPADFDRTVELLRTDTGWAILLHPPRMV